MRQRFPDNRLMTFANELTTVSTTEGAKVHQFFLAPA